MKREDIEKVADEFANKEYEILTEFLCTKDFITVQNGALTACGIIQKRKFQM
mgnify:CR=1 FL=1